MSTMSAPASRTAASQISLAGSEGESFAPAASLKSKGKQRALDNDDAPIPSSSRSLPASTADSWIPARSWRHFVAGGLGGMCGGLVTQPFDVAKTRLQSSLFAQSVASTSNARAGIQPGQASQLSTRRLLYHFVETGSMLRNISREEGVRALFRGLGPTLVGVIPASIAHFEGYRSINFFTYGNGKQIYARLLNNGKESAGVHLISAATAGIITASATNPIWVVKTRLQLQDSGKRNPVSKAARDTTARSLRAAAPFSSTATSSMQFTPSFSRSAVSVTAPSGKMMNSLECIGQIWRHEGIKGFYRGLSASYLGVAEGTLQWMLYEQFKALRTKQGIRGQESWVDTVGAAGAAKLIATVITYPHEVVRTRLRQAPPPGQSVPKYRGLLQTFRTVLQEEGMFAFYNGLSPHLMRVVPNAAVMYSVYELVLKYG
ncbi:Pyrimidine nucleotide transporter, mitochondrial [Cystobasidiomycetes sp. EMM_F5]